MPLSISVGLSRKASRNYQSTGVTINVTAELDQSLLAKPMELQRQIDGLYSQAEEALNRQMNSTSGPRTGAQSTPRGEPRYVPQTDDWVRGNGHDPGQATPSGTNGHPRSGRSGEAGESGGLAAAMTVNQKRAIEALAQQLGLDPSAEVRQTFGLDFEGLSLREASQVIDRLKRHESQDHGPHR